MDIKTDESKKRVSRFSKLKYFSIPNAVRITIIAILMFFIALTGFYCYIVEKYQKYTDKKEAVFSYSTKADVGYEVYYIQNEVTSENRIEQGKVYISEFIDYIDTAYHYEFNADKTAQINGKYSAVAYLRGFVRGLDGDKIIWSKEYILMPEKKFSYEEKSITFNYDVPIKLDVMKEYADKVKSILKFNTNVKLTVLYNLSIEAKTDQGTINEGFSPFLDIPVTQEYFEITNNRSEEIKSEIDQEVTIISPLYGQKRIFYLVISSVLLLGLIFVLLFTEGMVLNPIRKKFVQIFKNYGAKIVILNSEIKLESKEYIEVTNINGLVKISEDLGKPILYDNKYNFLVIDEKINFIFILGKESPDTDTADFDLKAV